MLRVSPVPFFPLALSCLTWIALACLTAYLAYLIIDDENADMLADVVKCKKAYLRNLLFAFAVFWIVVMGYNRIHMNAHFLTDVCWGILITYCLYALTYTLVFSIFEKDRKEL